MPSKTILVSLALLSLTPGIARAGQVSVQPATAAPGRVAIVRIAADAGVRGLAAATLAVGYPADLKIAGDPKTSVVVGPIFPGSVFPDLAAGVVEALNTAQPQKVTVILATARGHNGPADIVTIPFQLPGGARVGARYTLTLSGSFYDESGNAMAETVGGGDIQVVAPPPAPGARVWVQDVTGIPGGPVLLEVDVDGLARNVAGAQLAVQYGNAVQVAGPGQVAAGTVFNGPAAAVAADTSAPGVLKISLSHTVGQSGPGDLALIQAQILPGTPPGTYPLMFAAAALNDPSGSALPIHTSDGTLTVAPPDAPIVAIRDVVGAPGQVVSVEIDGDAGVHRVSGALLAVHFGGVGAPDKAGLTLGPLIGGPQASAAVNDTIPGRLAMTLAGTEPRDGPGALAIFPLHIDPATPPGDYPLVLSRVSLKDPEGNNIPVQPASGRLTVATLLRGDANGDGRVTIVDVSLALRIMLGLIQASPDQLAALDFNGDGKVDIADVTSVLRIAVGLGAGG